MNTKPTIVLLLITLFTINSIASEPDKRALKAVDSMMHEAGAKTFSSMIDDNVLRNGKLSKNRAALAKELEGLPEGLSQILELEEIRIIDFDNVKASFTGVNQTRVKRVIEGLSGKYNNKEHYGIVVISKYRNKNPYKAVNAMVFRMSDWKIIALGDN